MNKKISMFFVLPIIVGVISIMYSITHFSRGDYFLLIFGVMFTAIPSLMFFMDNIDDKSDSEKKKKLKSKLIGVFIGLLFMFMGGGMLYFAGLDRYGFSFLNIVNKHLLSAILLIVFVCLGALIFFGSLFGKTKPKFIYLRVVNVTYNAVDNEYIILFADESADETSGEALDEAIGELRAKIYKYYTYTAKYGGAFVQNGVYEVDIFKYGSNYVCIDLGGGTQARSLEQFVDDDFIRI